jgi:hypothetical protein
VSLYFGELSSWFFCCKLRHTERGKEGIFYSFVAAKTKEAEKGRRSWREMKGVLASFYTDLDDCDSLVLI